MPDEAEARYWTARDAVAVTHEMDGWVDVSRVPRVLRESLPRAQGEYGDTWPLKDWALFLTAWRKWGMNPLWTELRDEARSGPMPE